jgi:hypothetical protein
MVNNIWIISGLFAACTIAVIAFLMALRAITRLRQLSLAVYDLDWSTLADLTVDVQKLKKQVQRYRNIENGEQHQASNKLIQDLEKQYYSKTNGTIKTMTGG